MPYTPPSGWVEELHPEPYDDDFRQKSTFHARRDYAKIKARIP